MYKYIIKRKAQFVPGYFSCLIEMTTFCFIAEAGSENDDGEDGNDTVPHLPRDCDVCGVVCETDRGLRAHRRTHSKHKKIQHLPRPIRSVSCSRCFQIFKEEFKLRDHLEMVHKIPAWPGGRPPHCLKCGREFQSEMSVRQHTLDVHHIPNLVELCVKCGKTFKLKINFRKHLAHKHGVHFRYEKFTQPEKKKIGAKGTN